MTQISTETRILPFRSMTEGPYTIPMTVAGNRVTFRTHRVELLKILTSSDEPNALKHLAIQLGNAYESREPGQESVKQTVLVNNSHKITVDVRRDGSDHALICTVN